MRAISILAYYCTTMTSKTVIPVSFSTKGTLTLPSDPKQLKKIVTHLFEYTYSNIKLDYDKISKSIDEELSESESSYDWEAEYEPGENDCELSYKTDNAFDPRDFDESPHAELFARIHTYVQSNGARGVRLKGVRSLTIRNSMGINTDTRGTRPLDSHLKFHPSYTVERGHRITLHDFIIASYKIKSHKFENWYELISGAETVTMSKTRVGAKAGLAMVIKITGDHGS